MHALPQLFHAEPFDLERVDRELMSIMKKYDGAAAGPSKHRRIAEFLINTVVASLMVGGVRQDFSQECGITRGVA